MMSPNWLLDILAALMFVVAAMSATRLATAPLPVNRLSAAERSESRSSIRSSVEVDTDIAQLLMCTAMAGILAPTLKTLPPLAWEAIFGLLTAWFAWRLVGDTKVHGLRSLLSGRRAAHLFHCAATVYMFAALTTPGSIDMMGMGSDMARLLKYPALALAFAFVLVCYSVWELLGQLFARRCNLGVALSAGAALAGDTAPTVACRIAMGVTMAIMLITS